MALNSFKRVFPYLYELQKLVFTCCAGLIHHCCEHLGKLLIELKMVYLFSLFLDLALKSTHGECHSFDILVMMPNLLRYPKIYSLIFLKVLLFEIVNLLSLESCSLEKSSNSIFGWDAKQIEVCTSFKV